MHSIMYTSLYRILQHTNSVWVVAWGVLGVSRLHCTLATGDIVSKYAAGLHARETLPTRWHRIVGESLRTRGGGHGRPLYFSPPARRRDILDFGAVVIDDAHQYAPPPSQG